MVLHLMTRGRSADYAYLGLRVASEWWADLAPWIRFERPTVIVRPGRVFISGIESPVRRDKVGTVIRYTLVVEAREDSGAEEALSLVAFAMADLVDHGNFRQLGARLDEIGDDVWESALAGDGAARSQAMRGAYEAIRGLGRAAPSSPSRLRRWYAAPSAESKGAFIDLSRELLGMGPGQPGTAALLNLADPKELRSLRATLGGEGPTGILLKGADASPLAFPGLDLRRAGQVGVALAAAGMIALVWSQCPANQSRAQVTPPQTSPPASSAP